jgi:hypothetical protein
MHQSSRPLEPSPEPPREDKQRFAQLDTHIYIRTFMLFCGIGAQFTINSIHASINSIDIDEYPMAFNSTKIGSAALHTLHIIILVAISFLTVGNYLYKLFELRSEASKMVKEASKAQRSLSGIFLMQFFSLLT